MRRIAAAAFVGLVVFEAGGAEAQVNVEQLRSDARSAPARATIEGSFTGRTGNVDSIVAGGAASGAVRVSRHDFFGMTQADYARFNGKTQVSKSFVHLRYDYRLLDWLWPEGFVQQQQDKFQRLQLRELVGTGPRFVILDEDDVRLAVGTAYMFEYERISVPAGAPDRPESTAHRWSNYVTATWKADSRVRMLGTVYVQPRFDAFDDARMLLETALVTELGKRFAVKVLMTLRHDTEPPTLVKTTDLEIKNSLVLRF